MKFKYLTISVLLLLSSFIYAQSIPKLGIASSIANDSILYASGYGLIGESVSRMVSPKLSEDQLQRNLLSLKKAKCKVYMCNVFFPSDIKIAGEGVNEDRVISYADTVFKRAKLLKIPVIVLGSGGPRKLTEGYDYKKAEKDFAALCLKLAKTAQKYDIQIVLENLNSTETNFITTLKEAASIVRRVNHPNFKLNADIYHMMKENESPQSIIDAGDIITYCEIAEKENRTPPGIERDDFMPYLKALKAINYNGYIFIEGRWTNLGKEAPIAKAYLEDQLKVAYAK